MKRIVDEGPYPSELDRLLVMSWDLTPGSPEARRVVLVGRLQRSLNILFGSGVVVDGKLGTNTLEAFQKSDRSELSIGPELTEIIGRFREILRPQ